MAILLAAAAVFFLLSGPGTLHAEAPPVEFGLRELRRAIQESGSAKIKIRTEISTARPETYRVTGYRVTGGDLRGLMYGLLAAADQIRAHGRLVPERGRPAVPIRGIRRFLHNKDLEQGWYYSKDYWRAYIEMLARNRFNRLNLVFAHQTAYQAPPYPFWVAVKEYPEIRVPGLSDAGRRRNLETLCFIAQTAADHAIDFTLGIWKHNNQPNQTPATVGLTEENIGPYSYLALKKVLTACPAIRSVQIRTNRESGIPSERQISFYRDYIYKALRESGRLVKLDLRGWLMSEGMLNAAIDSGVPMRLSSKYWAEHLGRPYQPAETAPNYSYINFLRRRLPDQQGRSRRYGFYWEIWALGSHRLLLWGSPDYVKRAAATLTLSDTSGFEIDEPLAQQGFGNRPGKWGIFARGQEDRKFWKWEFERYWLFYTLWGRLTYNPKARETVWMKEFKRRFGAAATAVAAAYRSASRVLNEIVAVNMPDPNMYMWPEINPGGLIDYYAAARPSDRRLVASFREAVDDRLADKASAKQTPEQTAARLREIAAQIDEAVAQADRQLPADHREWRGTRPDFVALADLARFHAHRQLGAERLTAFYRTANPEDLDRAETELTAALGVWGKLATFTKDLYPPNMAYGPEDYGHWGDKILYLEHDLRTLRARRWLLDRFGRFAFGFDFGGAPGRLRYLQYIHPDVEPRFQAVHPGLAYSEETGFGWASDGARSAVAHEAVARGTLRATTHDPLDLPTNALFGDSIRGRGAQTFRVRTGEGNYRVSLLLPDGNAVTSRATATNGVVDVTFPAGEWDVAGVILRRDGDPPVGPLPPPPQPGKPPRFSHIVPRRVRPGAPLRLTLSVYPFSGVQSVRLHYRPLNALEKFRTLEAPANAATFVIPGEELTIHWDMLYYFEVLSKNGGGWFVPDPAERTPYYVIQVKGR